MEHEFGASVRTGIVISARPGFARVRFPDLDNMRSMWLPVGYPMTHGDMVYWTLVEGAQVTVLLDAQGEDGFIACSIYSDADVPPVSDKNLSGIRWSDGAMVEYDKGAGALAVRGVQRVIVEASAELSFKAPAVSIEAATTAIKGNLAVDGNVAATGTVMDAGGNSNHHSH